MPTYATAQQLRDDQVAPWLASRGIRPRINWHGDQAHLIFQHVRRASEQLHAELVIEPREPYERSYLAFLNGLRQEHSVVAARVRELRQSLGEHMPLLVAFDDERPFVEEVFSAGATVALDNDEASTYAAVFRYLATMLRLVAGEVALEQASTSASAGAISSPTQRRTVRRVVGAASAEELVRAANATRQEAAHILASGYQPPVRSMTHNDLALLFAVPDEEFRSAENGRYDANKLVASTGFSLTQIAKMVGVSQQALSRTPDSPKAQDGLRALARIVSSARGIVGPERVRWWLNAQIPVLGMCTPASMMLEGRMAELLAKVETALEGSA